MTPRRRPAWGRPRHRRGVVGQRSWRSSPAAPMWRPRRWMRRRRQRAARAQPGTRVRHLPAGRRHCPASERICTGKHGVVGVQTRSLAWEGSYLTAKETVCQPVAPSGIGSASSAVWTAPVLSVARTVIVCRPGLGGLPREAPQPPGVVGVARAQFGRLPVAVVDADLDGAHPAVLRPRDAAERHRPLGDVLTAAGHVDAGFGLDRPARRPAQPRPVRLGAIESGQLEVDDPLGGRHVAVETRHHQPGGIAVLGRAAARRSCRSPAASRGRR